eukprot:SAG31_NODE_742_length_12424_cov_16.082353_7_plen_56_part_00
MDIMLLQADNPQSLWSNLFGVDGATIIEASKTYSYEKIHAFLISRCAFCIACKEH